MAVSAEIPLEPVGRLARLGPQVTQAVAEYVRNHGRREGAIQYAATLLNIPWTQARDALAAAEGRARPPERAKSHHKTLRQGKAPRYRRGEIPPYQRMAPEVARLRDVEGKTWEEIVTQTGWSDPTCKRAYDHHHRDAIREAAARGTRLNRGCRRGLGREVHERLRRKLMPYTSRPLSRGEAAVIAGRIGCGVMTVYREQRKLRASASRRAETLVGGDSGGAIPGKVTV
jgi:hypothetical protein